jgi:hypothetical protein
MIRDETQANSPFFALPEPLLDENSSANVLHIN